MLGARVQTVTVSGEGQLRVALCASIGLACMFGGIWLGDAQVVGCLDLPNEMLVMRVFSLVIYIAFFIIAAWYARRVHGDVRMLFGSLSIASFVLFLVGGGIVCFWLPASGLEGTPYVVLGWTGLFLTKLIGAPVSVGLACVFSRLGRVGIIRFSTWGMLGAFVLYSLFSHLEAAGLFDQVLLVVTSSVLLALSCVFGMVGMEGTSSLAPGSFETMETSPKDAGVIERPFNKVVTPGFVLMSLFSAMMLGYLRNGLGTADPHMDPVSLVTLAGLIVLAAVWRGLRNEHMFYGALLCTAAGLLLHPVLEGMLPGSSAIVNGIGVALFEVVTWTLAVWAARNCIETLVAASAARLAAVVGHLMGTVVVLLGVTLSNSQEEALRTCGLIIMFIYVVLLLILLKYPGLQAPFVSSVDAMVAHTALPPSVIEAASVSVSDSEHTSTPGKTEPDAPDAVPAEKDYWAEPCAVIATTYKLTARESEVLELLARGRDLPAMEEKLIISRNTLKMHIRHIYTKLDIHSKQDIIDMVEQVR